MQGGSSPTKISEWGGTPPPPFTGSKSLFPNPQQQQQEQELTRRPLLDMLVTAAGKNMLGEGVCGAQRGWIGLLSWAYVSAMGKEEGKEE